MTVMNEHLAPNEKSSRQLNPPKVTHCLPINAIRNRKFLSAAIDDNVTH